MENFSRKILKNYSLQNKHLFKKKAGNAKEYYQLIFDEQLDNDLKVLSKLYNSDIPFKIFGMHTNLYITERGYDGLFIDISSKNSKITFDEIEKSFRVTSNVTVSEFVNYTMKMGYNFASLAGIPGFIGSGVVGNSSYNGAKDKKEFADFVKKIILYDFKEGKLIEIIPDDKFFDTRNSFIKKENSKKTRYFVKEVILKSECIGEENVYEIYNEQMEKRRKSLEIGFKEGTAGSVWANWYIRKITGKSFPVLLRENPSINANYNGATYSPNGSHFFTTDVNTTDKDVACLFVHTINKMKELFNIELYKEVMILDYDGEIDLDTFVKRYI